VREGLTWLWSQKVLRSVVLISSYLYFVITASVLLVLAIVQQQHIPSVLYGLIVAAGGVGNLLGAVFAGIALFDSIGAIFMSSYRLTIVPDALQGRVSGIYRLILFSILTIGPSALGLSLEYLGVLPAVGIVWSGLLLITGFLFLNRHMRQATLP
jgi:hypothetical protein